MSSDKGNLPVLIAPSVLASDFGALAAECSRVIKDGADWLHMGVFLALVVCFELQCDFVSRCNGWVHLLIST